MLGQIVRHNCTHNCDTNRAAKVAEQLGRGCYCAELRMGYGILCSQREYRHPETKAKTEHDHTEDGHRHVVHEYHDCHPGNHDRYTDQCETFVFAFLGNHLAG
ncbi:hypothetical protein D3C81_1859910 [compost metagenome]